MSDIDEARTKRAIQGLELFADTWAQEVDVSAISAALEDKSAAEIEAMLRECFIEGAYRAALEKQRALEVYVIVYRNGPDCQFVEIETEDGKGVSVQWHTHGGGMHKIGPLLLAAAPEDSDD